ncbi:PGF-pre-PGF domain-containing protein [Methanolobus bombayensis]|uniref:PGF-pre-PGF domain-containing protein n=1 Tax=Methanolobus bombayensis TaxID=38023 RepID=UPI001AE73185|nr:PGF-pre-PGF domain-containing protein [Methanolobus bombayensis]MBP1907846.1 PGF-pre-PGF domain-containing protein [Methanolobus bombayensis]
MIKEETKRKKRILQLGLVLILVLLSVISASAAITPAGNGVVTVYGDNKTEYMVPTYLNFTATENAGDITELNIVCSQEIGLDVLETGHYSLSSFENVSLDNITFNETNNVLTISNGTNIIVHNNTQFSINISDTAVVFEDSILENTTYTFTLNTSVTTTGVPIYLTIDGEPSVVPVNYTQSSTTWVKNGTTLTFNTSITDAASGVKNATVDITSINASAGIIDLYNTFSDYWTNSSFIVSATDGEYNLPITSYDNVSYVNNSENFTVWVDNTKPTVTPNTYGETITWASNGTLLNLNVTVDDGTGSGVYNVSVGGGSVNNSYMQVPLSYVDGYWINDTIIVGTSTQGQINMPIFARDNLSNVNSTTNFRIWIDNVEPEVTPISPIPADAWVNNGSTLNLNLSAVDIGGANASNISTVTVNVSLVNSTTTAILSNIGGTDYWYNNSLLVSSSEGSIDLQIEASDNAGNVNNSVNLTLKVDNTNPVVSNESVVYTSGFNAVNRNETVLLNFTAIDVTSDLNLSAVNINVSNLNSSLNWETMTPAVGNNFTLSVIIDNSSTGTAVVPISVADNATNTNTSQSISVVLDNSGPLVTGVTPDGSQWLTNGSTIDINVSSTDIGDAGVQNLMVDISSVNATGTANLANLAGDYWTNSSLTVLTANEGTIDLPVSAYDNLSNLNNSVNLTIKVDNSAPVFTTNESVYPGGMNAINNGGTVTLNVTVSDAYSGVNVSTVQVNATGINSSLGWETLALASGDDFTLDVIVNTSSSGTVILPVRAADNLSMWNTSASISVEIDVAEPTVTPVSPISSMWFKDGDVLDLNASIVDAGTGVKNATVTLNNVNASTLAILEHGGSNYWINNSLIVDSSSEGTINLTVVTYDNATNFNNSVNLTINVDNTIPAVSSELAAYPSGFNVVKSGGTVLLNFTATDATSGLNTSAVMINVSNLNSSLNWETMSSAGGDDFTLSVIVDNSSTGNAVVPISVADNASNMNTSQSISVVLDNSAPLVTGITPDGSEWVTNSSTIDLNVSSIDADSGMNSVIVDTSDVSAASTAVLANSAGDYWTNSTLTVLTSNEGTINLTVSSYDNLSNVNSSVNLTLKVDNSAPVFTNTEAVYPDGLSGVRNGGLVTLNVTVTDAYSGLNASSVMVDASNVNSSLGWETMTSAGGDDFTLTVLVNASSGTLTLPLKAADNVSLWNTSGSISVEVDSTDPTVTAVSPTGSQWFKDGDTLDLNTTIVDSGTGVKNATVTLNGVNASTFAILEYAGNDYWMNDSLIVDLTGSEGIINLTVVAYDNVSNFDSSVNLSIKVDNTEPLVIDAQIEYATGYTAVNNGSTITLNATVSDGSLSGVSSVMSIDNISSVSASENVTLTQVSSTDYWKYSNLEISGAEGTYLLNVTATDEAGNVNGSSSATFEVIIDNTDPVLHNLTLSTEDPGSYGESIEVTVNVSDAGSGIKSVTAAGTALTDQGSNIWNGTISAGYGANTVTVIATDNASNAVTNTSLSYTGPDAPSSDSSSSSSSGGLSSTTREAFLESKSTYEGAKIVTQESSGKVLSDPVKVVSVKLTRTEVTGVEVESEVDIEKISVSVQKLDSKPDNIPGSAPGNVHSYLNIEVSELDAGKIAGASITFKVEKSWLEENGISTDDVVLSHYTGSKWDQLETSVSSDDGEYVYYVAKTPGFSTFAISTRSDSEEDYVASDDTIGSDADSGETESEATDEMPDAEEDKGTPGFGILLGIMGVSMVAALMRQKNRNE